MSKKRIKELENAMNRLSSDVVRLESAERENRDMRQRLKQLECYEEYGHDWVYQIEGCTEKVYMLGLFGVSYWRDCKRPNKTDCYWFRCRECSKQDMFKWSDLDANMRAQVKAIDPDLVLKPKKK